MNYASVLCEIDYVRYAVFVILSCCPDKKIYWPSPIPIISKKSVNRQTISPARLTISLAI